MSKYAFNVEFSITEYESGDSLAFKMDGERFEGGERTLKYSADRTYSVKVVTKPATEIQSINMNGSELSLTKEKAGEFKGDWKTDGMAITKRGHRTPLIVLIKFTTEGLLRAEFQSKVYTKNASHAVWGHKLKFVEWKCSASDDGVVNIVDQNFR